MLEWLLKYHLDIPELYFLLMALIVSQPVKVLGTEHTTMGLEQVWYFLWGVPNLASASITSSKTNICPEAVCVLLSLVRMITHSNDCAVWLKKHPETIIQLLFNLYQAVSDFMSVMMQSDVITYLVAVIFNIEKDAVSDSIDANELLSPTNGETTTPIDKLGCFVLNNSGNSTTQINLNKRKLTSHPVRKCVIDFLRVIVVDSLSLNMHGKTTPVIDLVLDAAPRNADLCLQIEYQTEIITAVMNHFLAADILVGEQAALSIVPLIQSHTNYVAPNVFYFTTRVIDKLWQGHLNRNPHDIFDFVIKLIAQAKSRSSALTLEQLHHSLNRSILYLLSRSTETIAEQMGVLEILHKIITHRLLIFGAGNHELDFIGCLTYCLLQLTSDLKIVLEPSAARNTTWHVNPQTDIIEPKDEDLNQLQVHILIYYI